MPQDYTPIPPKTAKNLLTPCRLHAKCNAMTLCRGVAFSEARSSSSISSSVWKRIPSPAEAHQPLKEVCKPNHDTRTIPHPNNPQIQKSIVWFSFTLAQQKILKNPNKNARFAPKTNLVAPVKTYTNKMCVNSVLPPGCSTWPVNESGANHLADRTQTIARFP